MAAGRRLVQEALTGPARSSIRREKLLPGSDPVGRWPDSAGHVVAPLTRYGTSSDLRAAPVLVDRIRWTHPNRTGHLVAPGEDRRPAENGSGVPLVLQIVCRISNCYVTEQAARRQSATIVGDCRADLDSRGLAGFCSQCLPSLGDQNLHAERKCAASRLETSSLDRSGDGAMRCSLLSPVSVTSFRLPLRVRRAVQSTGCD